MLKVGALVLALLWTLVAAFGLVWNFRKEQQETLEMARVQARAMAEKMIGYRHWNASHGGVYVEMSPTTPPNPYLADVPEREVVTPSGRILTMVNPAYMLREVFQLEQSLLGLTGRITSLRPINPANAPDAWERAALEQLELGEEEVAGVVEGGQGGFLRLMRPLQTSADCLKCHASQGDEIGSLRGGLSVSVTIAPLYEIRRPNMWLAMLGTVLFWLLGLAIIVGGGWRLNAQARQRRAAEDRVTFLDQYDRLTGLPNKRTVLATLEIELARARKKERPFCLILVDIDGFRKINNALGHGRGDQLLLQAGDRLAAVVGGRGIVGHFGSGAFPLMLPHVGGTVEAGHVIQELLSTFKEPFMIDGQEVFMTLCCGITLFPADGDDAGRLLQNAAGAMHSAKAKGKGSFSFFAPAMNDQAMEQMQLESELRRALESDELILHYQPQVDAGSGRVIGAEALVRWQHPRLGLLMPDRFLSVAEESGLMLALGDWVLGAACQQLRAWKEQGGPLLPVAINLSASQFQQDGLVRHFEQTLSFFEVNPRHLVIEVTESTLMTDTAQALSTMERLKQLGLRLSIDDFGTGYSSLSYLKHLPIDSLKIDQSFVRDLPQDADSRSIVAAILALAESLNLNILAEGVETSDQLEFLRDKGCVNIQGFLFSRPLSADAFTAWVDKRSNPPV